MSARISIAVITAALALAGCAGNGPPDRTPTPTASATASASLTPTVTATRTATATLVPPSSTPTIVPPSPTATSSATAVATATASPSPTATSDPLRLPDLHAEPDPLTGGRIVDSEGREVLLRGVNVNALAEYWPYGDLPTVFPFPESDADAIAAIGWNVVRLLLSWSRVEPAPGVYDAVYLEQVRVVVRLLASRGVYTILDLHQDAWGPTLAARPTEGCIPPTEPAFGWDGAPGWATLDGGAPRCASLGIRELSPAVSTAFANFFADAPGPGGIRLRVRYAAMLAEVARTLAGEPGVAGYDLMNEPNAFDGTQLSQLAELYSEALAAIRAAEQAAGSPPRLVLFEPGALWALLGIGATPDFARDRDVVYAPHLYQGGLDDQALLPSFQVAVQDATVYGGAPVLTGEWGSDPRRASDPNDSYFLEHQRLQDEFRIGATLWTWRESCGDPHKASDARAGRVPYVWGEFEVDCATNTLTGPRQDLIDQLTRGYVRAAPGRLIESRWEHADPPALGRLIGRGNAPAGGALLAFYPAPDGAEPALTVAGLDDVRLLPGPGGNLFVSARAAGGDWSIAVGPAP